MVERIYVLISVLALAMAAAVPERPSAQGERRQVVEIVAERFSFYPSEVKAVVGTAIEFRLESDDTDHGFRIVDSDVNVRIPKRGQGRATATFRPSAPGRYTFECSHVCGAGHNFMRGTIVVTEP